MTAVIGIDASLASTGLATVHRDGELFTRTVTTKGKRDDSISERAARLRDIVESVRSHLVGGHVVGLGLVVIEAPAGVAPGGSTWDRAGLWWHIVQIALTLGPVAAVSPTTRAKWAAGSGRADKAAVAAAMARRAPRVDIHNSDEADALALAWMGAQHLGWLPATAAERTSLTVVRWPDLISD